MGKAKKTKKQPIILQSTRIKLIGFTMLVILLPVIFLALFEQQTILQQASSFKNFLPAPVGCHYVNGLCPHVCVADAPCPLPCPRMLVCDQIPTLSPTPTLQPGCMYKRICSATACKQQLVCPSPSPKYR